MIIFRKNSFSKKNMESIDQSLNENLCIICKDIIILRKNDFSKQKYKNKKKESLDKSLNEMIIII